MKLFVLVKVSYVLFLSSCDYLSCIELLIDTVELTSDQEDLESDHKTTSSNNQSKLCIKWKVLLDKMSIAS